MYTLHTPKASRPGGFSAGFPAKKRAFSPIPGAAVTPGDGGTPTPGSARAECKLARIP